MRIARRSASIVVPSIVLGVLVTAAAVALAASSLGISPGVVVLHALQTLHAIMPQFHLPIADVCPGSLPGGC